MALVSLEDHRLTATAALVWHADLPRPLQQILFDAADGISPPGPAFGIDGLRPASKLRKEVERCIASSSTVSLFTGGRSAARLWQHGLRVPGGADQITGEVRGGSR
jgi:hypothetical protein